MIITVLSEQEVASFSKRAMRLERIGKSFKNYFIKLILFLKCELLFERGRVVNLTRLKSYLI